MPPNSFATSCLLSALDPHPQTNLILQWLNEIKSKQTLSVTPIEFSQLEQWHFEEVSGNLVHQSGKFFRVLGLVQSIENENTDKLWEQPIVEQAEIGILGFICRIENGVLRFLVQAKFEPGSMNGLQLAPTVQATHSNYTQVHQGAKPPYVEYFMDLSETNIIYDCLQSEHGCRFLGKKNRNIIIEVKNAVAIKDEFRWVTLRELQELAQYPNLLNMPARSILSAIDYSIESIAQEKNVLKVGSLSKYGEKILQSYLDDANFEMPLSEVREWVKRQRAQAKVTVKTVGLNSLETWINSKSHILPKPGSKPSESRAFSIGAVAVEAKIREVAKWSQPLIWCDRTPWISGLVTQVRNGALHCLIQNLFEPGLPNKSELAPTVSYRQPEASCHEYNPIEFKDIFDQAKPSQIRYDSIQSSEGGRFYFEQNRLMIVEMDPEIDLKKSDRHRWVTLAQLRILLGEYGWINIELRELIACLSLTGMQ